jgi:hypothetical protein
MTNDNLQVELTETLESRPDDFMGLIQLLEFEINQIRAEETRPGWTVWALLGGLASAFWLLTLEIEKSSISLINIALLFLLFSLIYDCIDLIQFVIMPSAPNKASGFRYYLPRVNLSQSRLSFLVEIMRLIILIAIAAWLRQVIGHPYAYAVYLLYGIIALSCVFGLGLSLLNFPLPYSLPSGDRVTSGLYVFSLLVSMFALVGLFRVLASGAVVVSASDYRIGGLGLTIILLLRVLSKGQVKTPLLRTLVEIRRELAFGRMDLDSAQRQTEIALMGMTVSDVFQDDIAKILEDWERLNVQIESATKEILVITSVTGNEVGFSILTEEQKTLIKVMNESVIGHLHKAGVILQQESSKFDKLSEKVIFLAQISPGVVSELSALIDKIKIIRKEAESKLKKLEEDSRPFLGFFDNAKTSNSENK